MRAGVSSKSGTGGSEAATAALRAVRTESAKGSSSCPARAGVAPTPAAQPSPVARPFRHKRRLGPATGTSSPQALPQQLPHSGQVELGGGGVAAVLVLHQPLFQAPVADGDAVGHADQLPVGEHGARALTTVVQNHVTALRQQVLVQAVSGLLHGIAAIGT